MNLLSQQATLRGVSRISLIGNEAAPFPPTAPTTFTHWANLLPRGPTLRSDSPSSLAENENVPRPPSAPKYLPRILTAAETRAWLPLPTPRMPTGCDRGSNHDLSYHPGIKMATDSRKGKEDLAGPCGSSVSARLIEERESVY